MGKIIGAVGCTYYCSENPATSQVYCQNKGTVQVLYELDNDPGWIERNITPPFLCSQGPCCATQISSGTTIYLKIDQGQVKFTDLDRNSTRDTMFVIGVVAIVGSALFLLCLVGLGIAYLRQRSAYTTV